MSGEKLTRFSRRAFLKASGIAAAALSGAGAILAACGGGGNYSGGYGCPPGYGNHYGRGYGYGYGYGCRNDRGLDGPLDEGRGWPARRGARRRVDLG
jgi:hypothetical protein